MALDRWIALVLLGICLAYGYTAYFTMDDLLALMEGETTLPPEEQEESLGRSKSQQSRHAASEMLQPFVLTQRRGGGNPTAKGERRAQRRRPAHPRFWKIRSSRQAPTPIEGEWSQDIDLFTV